MTVYLSNRDGDGKTNEEGHFRLLSQVLSGQVLGETHLAVSENTSLGMSVFVQPGDYRLETAPGEYAYMGWIDAVETVNISAADPSNDRVTVIALYVDRQAATSPAPPNNPGIAKLMAVDGAPAGSPTVPSNAAIQSAVGAGNPFIVLAHIAVGAGTSTITNSNITDQRTVIKLNDSVLASDDILQMVGPLLYPVGSIYTNADLDTNPATLLGFGTWSRFAEGRVPVGLAPSDTDFGTLGNTGGAKTVTLTQAQMPSHSHTVNPPSVTTSAGGQHRHQIGPKGSWGSFGFVDRTTASSSGMAYTSYDGNHNHSVDIPQFNSGSNGSGQSHTNLQPYIVVYMWRRTA